MGTPALAHARSTLVGFGLILLMAYGCTDGPTPPGGSGQVFLPLAAILPAGAAGAADAVDRWRVQVVRGDQEVLAEESGSFSPGQTSADVSISVPLKDPCEDLEIRLELWAGTALYYVGELSLTACVGEEPRVQEVPMTPGPGLPGPDLELTSLTAMPVDPTSDDPVTLTAVVRNLDLRPAEASVLWIRLDGESTPSSHTVPGLNQGQTFQVQRALGTLQPGVHTVTAVADASGDLTESNEGNNERGLSLEVTPAPRPDLVVSSLTHSPAVPNSEDPVTVTAVVRNDGNASAGPSVLRIQLDGEYTSNHDVPSLAPGESHVVQRSMGALPAGFHSVVATADVNNGVVESNEANNQRRDDFDAALALWPDLVVSSLAHSPTNPSTEDGVTITAVVRNDGRADAGASVLRLHLDGGSATNHSIPALAPGATYQVQRVLGTLAEGNHTVTATADVNGAVTESDEGNNQRTDEVNVTVAVWPDLVVSSLTHSPTNPTTDNSVTVTSVVRNNGAVSAGASVLRLQLDGGSATNHSIPALAPGATYQVQRVLGTLAAGNHTVTATADVNGTVGESNEGNNQATDPISVTAAIPPQLWVSTDSLAFWSPSGGTPAAETFTVRNVGGGTLNWNAALWDTGAGCVYYVMPSPASGSLGPGASTTVSVQLQGTCPLGTSVSNRSFNINGSDGSSIPFVLTYLVVPSLSPATWNPRYSVAGVNACTLPAGTGSWFTIRFDFEDREGDVGSSLSTVNVSYRFSTGATGSYSHPPGDPYISYSGTGYAGTVRTDPCYRFGTATYVDVTLTLVDGGGHASNSVTVRMDRPSGAAVSEPASSEEEQGGSDAGGIPLQPPALPGRGGGISLAPRE